MPQPNTLRILIGYGSEVSHARWAERRAHCRSVRINYEEGGENSVLHGDAGSEQFLSKMFNPAAFPDRLISMKGIYEYEHSGRMAERSAQCWGEIPCQNDSHNRRPT